MDAKPFKSRLRPLSAVLFAIVAAGQLMEAMQSGGLGSATSVIRLRATRLRRPEICRENLPRKSEDLPGLVIIGRVKEVYSMGDQNVSSIITTSSMTTITSSYSAGNGAPITNTSTSSSTSTSFSGGNPTATHINQNNNNNRALVSIGRVLKGNKQLVGSDIIVSGFNTSNSTPCPNFVKPNDTLILLLNHDQGSKYSIQGSNLLTMNLYNLDRINSIASDEPYKRRGPIDDILCEAHYCAYGRCVVLNADLGQVNCQCPDTCPPLPAPVCGSDNVTYANECHLIKEGCKRQRPLFVTKETSC